jgi:phosphoribosylamine--glycine ligase
MASEGYPETVEKGHAIRGLGPASELNNVVVFHAATTTSSDNPETVLTTGGRVLGVTAHAESLARAKLKAYEGVKEIRWRGAWCRKDIADKGLRHEQEQAASESTESSSPSSEGTA